MSYTQGTSIFIQLFRNKTNLNGERPAIDRRSIEAIDRRQDKRLINEYGSGTFKMKLTNTLSQNTHTHMLILLVKLLEREGELAQLRIKLSDAEQVNTRTNYAICTFMKLTLL